ncbi:alpha/beta hydrolase [Brevibacterium sp. HMSC24B04]|uniref:alpha/beta hydrolase n=1 Tax=Brevibacterium sp. HMSC24B04 TaxID=1581060 RepID=UPI0008A2FB2F|nr:alpha/beta hydrolase [Brevibacterium sp. HMSC24B04]OFT91472.1 hypothetical protein HMPREF3092_09895 [Brevibacterium sp. HMSC24B04]
MSKLRLAILAGLTSLSLTVAATPVIADKGDAPVATEERQIKPVVTPRLDWQTCGEAECAKVHVPLDYAKPKGKKIYIAVKKIPATGTSGKTGTLFVNPGGPGASGKDWVSDRLDLFPTEVRKNFDIVGFDPRGTNASTRLKCFNSSKKKASVYERLTNGFPVSSDEEKDYIGAAGELSKACADEPLAQHMSTTDVALDMDMLRRAVGDTKLTYLGFSYGTYLGQVYAAMFPNKVRAMVLDGVIDAEAWRGNRRNAIFPMPMRMGNAQGASEALTELLDRCSDAGESCPLEDPDNDLENVMEYLRKHPLKITEDGETYEATYSNVVDEILYSLYSPDAEAAIDVIAGTKQLIDESVNAQVQRDSSQGEESPFSKPKKQEINDLELNAAVVCSDSHHPDSGSRWTQLANRADKEAPYFGRQALWSSIACAEWTANDDDAFAGSFSVDSPALIVGARWDPATSYAAAKRVNNRLPHSTLLTSNNWGHTSYGVSQCADDAINDYLITGEQPAADITCSDGVQPYTD